jgi:hypothetical protein
MFGKAVFDQYLEQFPAILISREELPNLYMWDAQQHFAQIWDIERLDFDAMYAESLHSTISNRLWTGVDYHPKESMISFLRYEKEFIRSMFRDLFNEAKDLQMRISRFIFHCDELGKQIKKKEPKFLHHYHDEQIIMAYLALHDPQRYVFIDIPSFRKAMEAMQARNIPEYITIESYTKLMRIIQKFILTDPSLANGYRTLFPNPKLYVGGSMLIALDFVQSAK